MVGSRSGGDTGWWGSKDSRGGGCGVKLASSLN